MNTNASQDTAQQALIQGSDQNAINDLLADMEAHGKNTGDGGEVIEKLNQPAGSGSTTAADELNDELDGEDIAALAQAGLAQTQAKAAEPSKKGKKETKFVSKGKTKVVPAKPNKQAKGKAEAPPQDEGLAQGDATPADAEATGDGAGEEQQAAAPEQKKKEPPKRRVTYSGNRKSVVLSDRLNGRTSEFLILEKSDALLEPEELEKKQAEFMRNLDTAVAKKVAEKCIMLMKDLTNGNKVKNEVMNTAFYILKRDGKLTSGDQGNLQKALLAKYSLGTARSQANQIFCLFPLLKITTKEKGLLMPNPNSNILVTVNGEVAQAE